MCLSRGWQASGQNRGGTEHQAEPKLLRASEGLAVCVATRGPTTLLPLAPGAISSALPLKLT